MTLIEQLRTWDEIPDDDAKAFHWLDLKTAEAADLIDRQAAHIEMMREAARFVLAFYEPNCILDTQAWKLAEADLRSAVTTTPDQALEQSLAEYRNKVIEAFVNEFSRHVGGDGEFWLHELQDFAMKEQP